MESLVELLAPAGTKEAFYAAVENGANAVYLAGKMFGARAYAANFDEQELSDVIRYAHLKNVQVHVAVNTIIDNEELPKLKEYLSFLSSGLVLNNSRARSLFSLSDVGYKKIFCPSSS